MEEKSQQGVLKEHMIFQKTHTTSLADVRTLNMWGFELSDVSIVEKMPNVETISLSLNKISTLRPFANCRNLKSLFLRKNNITNLSEIDYLAGLPNLRSLMLRDNPVSFLPNYRSYIAKTLPYLEKLDDQDVGSVGYSDPAPEQAPQYQNQYQGSSGYQDPRDQREVQHYSHAAKGPMRNQQQRESERLIDMQSVPSQAPQRKRVQASSSDDSMLAAVLALIPELSDDALQIVLDAIRNRRA